MAAWSFFKSSAKPLLIAHRGASGYAPENTLIAFKMAIDMGVRFIEFDVHQTRDGRPVVIHDEDLKRSIGLRRKVHELTFDELRKHPIKLPHAQSFPPEFIPSLEEALDLVARRAVIDVEIKGGPQEYPGIEEKTIGILEKKGYLGMSYISSFSLKKLLRARELSPVVPLAYILGGVTATKAFEVLRAINGGMLVCSLRQVGQEIVHRAHGRGLYVGVYTVNKEKVFDKMAKLKVDAIFTDYPDLCGIPEFEALSVGLTDGD